MEIGYTPEQEAMRSELRAYYEKLLDEQTVAELAASHAIGAAPRRVWKQMCADGWAGIGWPKEYGGRGATAIEQFIFFDESMRAGRTGTDAHHQHRRADDHALRYRRAEGVLPSQDPRR